jgi:cystathionine beta-lyase/cystathionine gamma-synthase
VFTQDITVQSFTIYTFFNSAKSDNDCILGYKIMGLIGDLAQEKRDATLSKEDVIALLPKNPSKNTQVQQDIRSIVNLFKEDNKLGIISNTVLSPYPRSIADTTATGLKKANKNIIVKIWDKFRAKIM